MPKRMVIDADSHILEPIDLWESYMEERELLPLAPRFFDDEEGNQQCSLEGEVLTKKGGMGLGGRNVRKKWDNKLRKQRWEEQEPGGFDPHKRIVDMDEEGVHAALLFPTIGLRFSAMRDSRVAAASCRAYNKWLADYCKPYPGRLFGMAAIPFQEPELAVKEMRFAVEKLGFRGVLIRPNPVRGRNMDNPELFPIWEAAQDLDVVVACHEGGILRHNPQIGHDRFSNFAYIHAAAHPMEMQMAFMCMAFGGVFERFPKLKVSFLESGAGWLPFWLERLDNHFEKLGWIIPECKAPPSEYFRRQCVIQVESEESTIPMVAKYVGEDYIVWGTDYPHFDCCWLGAVGEMLRHGLTSTAMDKIMGLNIARFYGLPEMAKHDVVHA